MMAHCQYSIKIVINVIMLGITMMTSVDLTNSTNNRCSLERMKSGGITVENAQLIKKLSR